MGRRGWAVFAAVFLCAYGATWAAKGGSKGDEKLEILKLMERMVAVGRTVVSDHQKAINDPTIGDKGFNADTFEEELKVRLLEQERINLEAILKKKGDTGQAAQSMLNSMREVITDAQPLINKQGMGFKGFLPAVWARRTLETFNAKGTGIKGKLTAKIFRNAKNAPDAWEKRAIDRFLDNKYPVGKPISETVETEQGPAVRYIKPEYYKGACLSCHGEPKGEMDITGYKKEGFRDGEPGGALSFIVPLRK